MWKLCIAESSVLFDFSPFYGHFYGQNLKNILIDLVEDATEFNLLHLGLISSHSRVSRFASTIYFYLFSRRRNRIE